MQKVPDGIFKPTPTTGEKKSDTTTRAAQQIIDAERLARETKTERLRLARLEKEQDEPVAQPAKAGSRKRKARV